MYHVETYLKEHPDKMAVVDLDKETIELLEWAYRKKYIALESFEGRFYCTRLDIKDAKTWSDKILGTSYMSIEGGDEQQN